MHFYALLVISVVFISVKCDECSLVAICNCTVTNATAAQDSSSVAALIDPLKDVNICNTENHNNSTTSLKYSLSCRYVNLKNNSKDDLPVANNTQEVILKLNYPCESPHSHDGHSTGTILVVVFFTLIFAYIGMGVAVNYFIIGARGIELFPHIGFWKDFPYLVRDGVKFLRNGCKARPSELNPNSPDSYDAI